MNYYLSIVATSRNDNHGGDLNQRTSDFIKSVIHQSEKWKFRVELIIVEWNPPGDKQHLYTELPRPGELSLVTLKYIVVPENIHIQYKNADTIPLYQMIAKNVGIRRAKGEFILCTNVDILFSEQCFGEIAKTNLKKGSFYRTNRCDVPKDVMNIEGLENKLSYCRGNIIKRIGKAEGYEAMFLFPSLTRHIYKFERTSKLVNKLLILIWQKLNKLRFPYFIIDFDACGDFTLMSKQDWFDIQGYAELDMYSIHIDSMALWAAFALKKKQVIFPFEACIYHIDHENGWESNDVVKTMKFLESKPCLDYSIVFKGGVYLVDNERHWGLNKSDWGFADEKFKEYIFEPGKEMTEIN